MNLKWNAPEVMAYYLRSRAEKNAQISKALEICRKNVFFTLRECPKRNLLLEDEETCYSYLLGALPLL